MTRRTLVNVTGTRHRAGSACPKGWRACGNAARNNLATKFTGCPTGRTVDLLRASFCYSSKAATASGRGHKRRNARSEWKIDWSISMAEFIVERIGEAIAKRCTSEKRMGGNVHWRLRPWQTDWSQQVGQPATTQSC